MAEPASRKERIMREATRLYGSADPPSVNAIAQAAGVSRSTLYRIFPRRTTLLDALEIAPGPGTRQRVLEAAFRRNWRARLCHIWRISRRTDGRRPAPADTPDARRSKSGWGCGPASARGTRLQPGGRRGPRRRRGRDGVRAALAARHAPGGLGMAAEPTYSVEVEGVSKRFGAQPALDDVTLRIRRGEVYGILGPNV